MEIHGRGDQQRRFFVSVKDFSAAAILFWKRAYRVKFIMLE